MSPSARNLDGAMPWGDGGGGYACPTALHLHLQRKLSADACDTPSTYDPGTPRELPDPASGPQSSSVPAYGLSDRISPDGVLDSPGSPFLPRPLLPPPAGGIEGDGSAAARGLPRDGDPGRSAWRRAVTAAAGHAGGQKVDVVDVLGAPVRPDVQYTPEVGEYVPRRAFPGGRAAAAVAPGSAPGGLEGPAGGTPFSGGGDAEALGLTAPAAAGGAGVAAAAAMRRSEAEDPATAAASPRDGDPGRSAWRRAVTMGAGYAGGQRVDVADVLGAPVRPGVGYTPEQGEYVPRRPLSIAGGMPPLRQPAPGDGVLAEPPSGTAAGVSQPGNPGRSAWRRAVVTAAGHVGGQGSDVVDVLGSARRQGGSSLAGAPESPRSESQLEEEEPTYMSPPDTPDTISYSATAFGSAATAAAAAVAARGKWGQAARQQGSGTTEGANGAVALAGSPNGRPLSAGRTAWGLVDSPKDSRALSAGGVDAAEASALVPPEPSPRRRTLGGTGSVTAKSRMSRDTSLTTMAAGPAVALPPPLQAARSNQAASPGRSSYSGGFTSGGVPDGSGSNGSGSTGGMGAGPSSPRGTVPRLRAVLAGRSSHSGVVPMALAASPAAAGPTRLAWDTGASSPRPGVGTAAGSRASSPKSGAHEAQSDALFLPRAARSPFLPASAAALQAATESSDRRPMTTGHSALDSKLFALFRPGSAKGRAGNGQGNGSHLSPTVLRSTNTWLGGQGQAAASSAPGGSPRSRTLQETQSPRGLRSLGSDDKVVTWRDNLLAREAHEGLVPGRSSMPGVR